MQHDFVLLDRSGSMSQHWRDWVETLGALNGYVKGLADKNVDTVVTVATFDKNGKDSSFDIIRDRITPTTWKAITDEDTSPRGYTPLNDAIGKIVNLAKAGYNGVQYDKVALIIITDGQENASIEFTHAQAKALLEECRGKGWQVIFLGVDFDNTAQASSYKTSAAQFVQVRPANMGAATATLSATRAVYASTGKAMGFTDEEKNQLRQ